jgi:glycosyltransferase involved in cell wall biosynthesis
MRRVHQLVASAVPGDAVTDQAFAWRTVLRYWGHKSDVFAEHVHPALTGQVLPLKAARFRRDDALVMHYAVWTKALEQFLDAPSARVLYYHNITPGDLLRDYNPVLAEHCDRARAALPEFRGRCAAVIAVSEFNARELRASGMDEVSVVPLLLNISVRARDRIDQAQPVVLTVGRLAPNKRLEDVLKAFALYQRYRSPRAKLVVVGPFHEFESYRRKLESLAGRLGAENVLFTGRVSHDERDAWYRRASAYICSSIHEGFCAPVIEALANGAPVVARAAGAVPETLGNAGILLEDDEPAVYAEALHEVVSSQATRALLARSAERRLAELAPARVADRLKTALVPVLGGT